MDVIVMDRRRRRRRRRRQRRRRRGRRLKNRGRIRRGGKETEVERYLAKIFFHPF